MLPLMTAPCPQAIVRVRAHSTRRRTSGAARARRFPLRAVARTVNTDKRATVTGEGDMFRVVTNDGEYMCRDMVLATGRSGSKWISEVCGAFGIEQKKNRVDIGVRVELPALVFKHITDQVYESKIVYKTKQYSDLVRTFCMNPYGEVVSENTNGIVTVNGHSYV